VLHIALHHRPTVIADRMRPRTKRIQRQDTRKY
jgi:hypothetical protein